MAVTLNHKTSLPIIHNCLVRPFPCTEEGGLFHDATTCSGNWRGGGTAAFVVVPQQLAGRGSAALAVVSGTSQRQCSDDSSDGGAAIGMRCDDWLRPPFYYYAKNMAGQNCSAQVLPGALIFAPGSTFLLLGRALFCCGVFFFAGITQLYGCLGLPHIVPSQVAKPLGIEEKFNGATDI
jgi:hypothetical protein